MVPLFIAVVLFFSTPACAAPITELGLLPPPKDALHGTIEVDTPNPTAGKRFQGVWLVTPEGTKKLVAYNTKSVWAQFNGLNVTVSGTDYTPKGQAILADHYRIERLTVTKAEDATQYTSAGPEKEWTGTLRLERGEPGSKMANETWWVFTSGGVHYQILNPSRWTLTKAEVTLIAHDVQRSPFSAHMSGPSLWVTTLKRR